MTNENTEDSTASEDRTWHYTLLALAILVLTGSILWLFFVEMSFEPLIGVLVGVGGIITYHKQASKFVDLLFAIGLIIFFLACVILILSSKSSIPSSISPNLWSKWILGINIILAFLIVILAALILRLSLKNVNQSRIAKLIAWAISGKTEETVLYTFFDGFIKILVSIILWAFAFASVWVLAVLLITLLAIALDSQISGTIESITQYGLLGGIMGGVFGLVLAIFRLNTQ